METLVKKAMSLTVVLFLTDDESMRVRAWELLSAVLVNLAVDFPGWDTNGKNVVLSMIAAGMDLGGDPESVIGEAKIHLCAELAEKAGL